MPVAGRWRSIIYIITRIFRPETYRQVYGEPVVYNQIYLKTDSTDAAFEQNLRAALLEKENITQVTSNTETIRMFQETVDNMMAVVVVLILSAGFLAFVVSV